MEQGAERQGMRMKPMLPSLREKRRYLVFEVVSKNKLSSASAVSSAVQRKTAEFLGELEAAKAGVHTLHDKWDSKKRKGVIRLNRKYVNHLKAALCMISRIENRKVVVKSVGVSGMLNKAEKKFMAS
jgi:RNase P/RNase MRP subunit POP5